MLLALITGSVQAVDVISGDVDLSCIQVDTAGELQCDYRTISAEPVLGISATTEDKILSVARTGSYPRNDSKTAVLILVDTSDPARQNVIDENQKIIGKILGSAPPHAYIGLAGFDKALRMEAPPGSSHDEILAGARRLRATGMTTELYKNTLSAINVLKKIEADRKSIFLLSDGLAEDQAYFHADVVKAARAAHIVITSMGFPRSVSRSVGLQTLRRMSEETGGLYIESDLNYHLPDDFLGRLFATMDNGGTFTVDIDELIASPRKDKYTVAIEIQTASGGNQLVIPLRTAIPPAAEAPVQQAQIPAAAVAIPPTAAPPSIKIITREVTDQSELFWPWYTLLVGLVFLLVLVITAFFFLVYRQGKRKPAIPVPVSAEHKPYAYLVLQDETKMRYPITRSTWRIGRGSDNEMTLQDNSVSRRHAEINRDKGDVFTIFDLDSLNGIFVNNNKVTKQILHEGDTIEIGDVALRFTMFSNEYSMEDSTVMQHTKTPLTH